MSSGAPDDVEGQKIQCPQHTIRLGGWELQLRNCFVNVSEPMDRELAVVVAGEGQISRIYYTTAACI